jgi:ABC-type phosphate transport system substrate-binding protein
MRTLVTALILSLLGPSRALAAPPEEPAFRVIVHRSNPESATSVARLQALFMKTTTRWPGGAAVQPVELRGEPPARQEFARRVHGKSLAALKAHWNKLIFSGREVPPLELGSDDEIVAYVKANEGAIGVVSGAASTAGTKVLPLTD